MFFPKNNADNSGYLRRLVLDEGLYLGKRACLDVSSGEIGAQSPRARDPMSPLDTSKHDLFPL